MSDMRLSRYWQVHTQRSAPPREATTSSAAVSAGLLRFHAEPVVAPSRPIRMTLSSVKLRAGALLVGAVLAGCSDSGATGEEPPPSAQACPIQVVVTEADAGSTICVARRGVVTVTLHIAGGQHWGVTSKDPGILRPPGAMSQPMDFTELPFTTVASGRTTLTAQRPNCPAASPGTVSCHSIQVLSFVVKVSSQQP
jgi:hypothetical protein